MTLYNENRPAWQRYSIALLIVFAAAWLRLQFLGALGMRAPYITFYPAVMIAALFGGFYPGLLGTAASGFLATLWIETVGPPFFLDPGDMLGMIVFLANCVMVSGLAEVMQRAEARAAGAEAQVRFAEEREEAARQLAKSETRLRLAQEAAKVGTWEWAPDSVGNFWSDELWKLYGLVPTAGAPLHDTWLQTIHPDDRSATEQIIRETTESGAPLEVEFRVPLPGGGERRLLVRGSPVIDAAGKVERYLGIAMDITELRFAEEALRQSNARIVDILETMGDAFIGLDRQWRYTYVNAAAEKNLRRTRDELLGRDIREMFPDGEAFYRRYEQVMTERKPVRFEEHYASYDVWVDVRVFPASEGISVFYTDITELKRLETERGHIEEQLRQSAKLEAVGFLAGGIAHDLNNMLTPVLGYSEMLAHELPPGSLWREDTEQIVRSAFRARELVHQLLAFARKQTIEMKLLDLNDVMNDFEKLLRRTLRENIALRTHRSVSPGTIMGELGQIELVILNLAVNAQDAMPAGGTLAIEVSDVELDEEYAATHPEVTPGPYAMIAVSDTGEGMDAATLSKIFDPFFTTKPRDKGTGLGLSTVYGIVKQHGGHIWVYSEPGEGTTFRVYFPRVDRSGKQKAETVVCRVDTGTETVLVVEDQTEVLNIVCRILSGKGYNVLSASGGEEAMERMKTCNTPLDLLITDVIMKGMNGKELYTRMTEHSPELKNLRVLYMSGYTADVIAHHGVLDAGVHLIQKPFSIPEFLEKVRFVLDQNRDAV